MPDFHLGYCNDRFFSNETGACFKQTPLCLTYSALLIVVDAVTVAVLTVVLALILVAVLSFVLAVVLHLVLTSVLIVILLGIGIILSLIVGHGLIPPVKRNKLHAYYFTGKQKYSSISFYIKNMLPHRLSCHPPMR